MKNKPQKAISTQQAIESYLQRTLSQLTQGRRQLATKGGSLVGAIAVTSLAMQSSCDGSSETWTSSVREGAIEHHTAGLFGMPDWAQQRGKRDTSMVRYLGEPWIQWRDCSCRGGCQTLDLFLKVLVRPVHQANLNAKRVGIIYQDSMASNPTTVVGSFFTTLPGGMEEWHISISQRNWYPGIYTLTAWYQDGRGYTFYDDNNGERHAVSSRSADKPLYQDFERTKIHVTPMGVKGSLVLQVMDLDYDKEIRLVCTTDHWQTVHQFSMGTAQQSNVWFWQEDLWGSFEQWTMNLDLQQPLPPDSQFEYAILYRHGIKNGARSYDFWDNNYGQNYAVTFSAP
jgi:hypothetical protein